MYNDTKVIVTGTVSPVENDNIPSYLSAYAVEIGFGINLIKLSMSMIKDLITLGMFVGVWRNFFPQTLSEFIRGISVEPCFLKQKLQATLETFYPKQHSFAKNSSEVHLNPSQFHFNE